MSDLPREGQEIARQKARAGQYKSTLVVNLPTVNSQIDNTATGYAEASFEDQQTLAWHGDQHGF